MRAGRLVRELQRDANRPAQPLAPRYVREAEVYQELKQWNPTGLQLLLVATEEGPRAAALMAQEAPR